METIRELRVKGKTLTADGIAYPCTVGRAGITTDKREGDLKTPIGSFALRGLYYRPDRMEKPITALPVTALTQQDGWCDDPSHPEYNKPVKLPFAARHEKLWREDHVYDLIIPLGYNDEEIVPGRGSAIFLHLMRPDGLGTEGCIALKLEDLQKLLPRLSAHTQLIVDPA